MATQLCASHPSLKVSLCNTRSFASLSKVVVQLAPSFLGIPPASKKGRALRVLARGAMIVTGWEYNSFNNWQKVEGFKWLEFSSADHIIPHELSLHAAVTAQEVNLPLPYLDPVSSYLPNLMRLSCFRSEESIKSGKAIAFCLS